MRKILFICLTLSLSLRVDRSAYAQGTLVFNNLGPDNGKVLVSASPGAFTPLNEDINFYLRVFGPGPVRVFERSWLLSDGTAKGINVGPGLFADPTGSVIVLPAVAPGTMVSVSIDAWTGNYPTFNDALKAGAAAGGGNLVMLTGTIEAPPASLERMPDFNIIAIPEPKAFSLAILGMTLFLLHQPRKRRKTT